MDLIAAFLEQDVLGKEAWLWLTFLGIVAALLAFDLGVLHRKEREIGITESVLLSLGYIGVALLFGAWIWSSMGREAGTAPTARTQMSCRGSSLSLVR